MTKTQYIANLILFLPLSVINFFVYGADGVIYFVKAIKSYQKRRK